MRNTRRAFLGSVFGAAIASQAIAMPPPFLGGIGLHNPEVITWAYRSATFPTNYTLFVTDLFITALKNAGVWTGFDGIWLLNTDNINSALLNLVSTSGDLTPIPSKAAITAAWTQFGGVTGDSASLHMTSSFIPGVNTTQYQQDYASQFMYAIQAPQALTNDIGELNNTSGIREVIRQYTGTPTAMREQLLSQTSTANVLNVAQGPGWAGWSRLDANNIVMIRDSGNYDQVQASLGGVAGNNFNILSAGGSNTAFSGDTISLVMLGRGFTDTECSAIYNAVIDYLTAMGTIDGPPPIDPTQILPAYFTRAMSAGLTPANVVQMIYPPTNPFETNANYAFFPGTHFFTFQDDLIAASTDNTVNPVGGVWDMRYAGNPYTQKPNVLLPQIMLNNLICRPTYSTLAKAQAATQANVAYNAGYAAFDSGNGYLDILQAAGFTVDPSLTTGQARTWNSANTDAATIFVAGTAPPYVKSLDYVIFPNNPAATNPACKWLGIDSETGDGRSHASQLTHVTRMASLAAGKGMSLMFFIDPLNTITSDRCGFGYDVNWQIMALPNVVFAINLWPRWNTNAGSIDASYSAQINFLQGPDGDKPVNYSKLCMIAGIGNDALNINTIDPNGAAKIRNWMVTNNFGYVMIWRDSGTAGGDAGGLPLQRTYNRILGTLLGLPIF